MRFFVYVTHVEKFTLFIFFSWLLYIFKDRVIDWCPDSDYSQIVPTGRLAANVIAAVDGATKNISKIKPSQTIVPDVEGAGYYIVQRRKTCALSRFSLKLNY